MNILIRFWVALVFCSSIARGDEGMWLFNALPVELLRERHQFEPTTEWAEHLMKSSVRFNVGGSASFVSSTGLVLTNHHVGSDTLAKLSTPERNIIDHGYLARDYDEELKAPDLELNQLVNIVDVTAQVQAAVTPGMSPQAALVARRAAIDNIEKKALGETGLRSDVVTLYGGGRYHLYQFKKYTDVRLVWAPETAAAFFGGDADNFEYPRYCLDACLFRVYENDQPAKIEHFLRWSEHGPAAGEVVFVSGNPGRTSRIFTSDALAYLRDVRLPFLLNQLRRREILLQQFSLRGSEHARRAREDLFSIQNSRKARLGMLAGLQDPNLLTDKKADEQALRAAYEAKFGPQSENNPWAVIADVCQQRAALQGKGIALYSQLFGIAQTLVQMAIEDQKPSEQRLREFGEAGRASLLQQLFSEAPIYLDLDTALLGDALSNTVELRGFSDPLCQAMLAGMKPGDRAAQLIRGTQVHEVAFRRQLAEGGWQAIQDSDDPLIQLALLVDDEVRKFRNLTEQLDELEKQAYAQIAEILFETKGTSTYPDATFSLRLSFGTVQGYTQDGESIPAWTLMGDAFEHETQHAGQADYQLPESWHAARMAIDGSTPFNFVCTADIIGGNSGSPVVNRNLELVGLIFDGNIQSLTADFIYSDDQARATSVHSSAIREALLKIYGAEHLVEELGR